MPRAVGRRVGSAVLAGLVTSVLLLTLLPGDPGSLRLGGVGALWWLAVLVAPLAGALSVAILAAATAARAPGLAALAAWAGPAVLIAVAARVFAGAADAPVVVLVVLLAPLAALLSPPRAAGFAANRVASLATLAAAALVLWGSFAALADVAEVLRVRRWQAAVLAAALALLAGEWRPRRARARPVLAGVLLVAGAVGFVLPVVAVGATVGAAPWSAWSLAASRPAFTFDERSVWVTEGRALTHPETFDFSEAHRVTALAPGAYRIVEPVGPESGTRPIAFDYTVKLGPREEGYPIREQHCVPAPGDTGHMHMCRYTINADELMSDIDREKPLLGQPLNDVLTWEREYCAAGCYCEPASRKHKWGLVLETIHYALAQK